jgi:hypothetical protein
MKSMTCHGMSLEITGYHVPISRLYPGMSWRAVFLRFCGTWDAAGILNVLSGICMRNRWIENYLYLGLFLLPPLLIGYCAGKKDFPRRPGVVTVDIMREGDEILVYEHYSGNIIREIKQYESKDRRLFKEFQNLLGQNNPS